MIVQKWDDLTLYEQEEYHNDKEYYIFKRQQDYGIIEKEEKEPDISEFANYVIEDSVSF